MRKFCMKPGFLFCAVLGVIALAGLGGCGKDDKNCAPYDEHQFPQAGVEIRVNESNFNPSDEIIHSGTRVEWQNRFRQTRTVISGTGPSDPHAGELFDETLPGYCSGEAIGGRFQFVAPAVSAPDTIYYFNSILPSDFVGTFGGRLIIVP